MEGVVELLVFGKPGEPVPAVNAEELQRVVSPDEDVRAQFGDQVAIDPAKYGSYRSRRHRLSCDGCRYVAAHHRTY